MSDFEVEFWKKQSADYKELCKDYKELMQEYKQQIEWIGVKDKPPEANKKLLFVNGKKEITFGYAYKREDGWDTGYDHLVWINDFISETNEVATHWMPLPNPPNEIDEMIRDMNTKMCECIFKLFENTKEVND